MPWKRIRRLCQMYIGFGVKLIRANTRMEYQLQGGHIPPFQLSTSFIIAGTGIPMYSFVTFPCGVFVIYGTCDCTVRFSSEN